MIRMERELAELPEVVRKDVKFVPVAEVDEVFSLMFDFQTENNEKPKKKRAPKPHPIPLQTENNHDGGRC